MSAVEQLDWVKKYFQLYNNRYKNIDSFLEMYLTILYPKTVKPAGVDVDDNDIIFRNNGQAKGNPYKQNPSFMKEKGEWKKRGFSGGVTYAWEVKKEISHHYDNGEKAENRSFKSICFQVVQRPINETVNFKGEYLIVIDGKMVSKVLGVGTLYIYRGKNLEMSIVANSGGFGSGAPPNGEYVTHTYRNRTRSGSYNKGMNKNGVGFSFNIDPQFSTKRSLLRIHPDGNNRGTLGCVGLSGSAKELTSIRDKINEILKNQKSIKTKINIDGNPNNHIPPSGATPNE